MIWLTSGLGLMLCIVLVFLFKWANQFVALYQVSETATNTDYTPHVGVILALRGADPFLEKSLRGLMSLEYPSHEIRIIIDSATDPAFAVVDRVHRDLAAQNVTVEILIVDQATSSLKNAALIQGIRGCSDRCEAYAWLDSDTVPHPQWLKDLMAPLHAESVGATCGIRWYAPPTATLANYVRHIWNTAAVNQMVAFEIGWGGAFAIRKSVYQEAGLESKWSRALVEDTLAANEILLQGRHIQFVANCTMSNPESASMGWCVKFVTRQLQGLRYYHSAWTNVCLFGMFSGAALVGTAVAIPLALLNHDSASAAISTFSLIGFGLVAVWLMNRSERCVYNHLGSRAAGGCSHPLMLIVAAPLTQLVHFIALIRVSMLSQVSWRGIHYIIRSGHEITRTNYQPFVAEHDIGQQSL